MGEEDEDVTKHVTDVQNNEVKKLFKILFVNIR